MYLKDNATIVAILECLFKKKENSKQNYSLY